MRLPSIRPHVLVCIVLAGNLSACSGENDSTIAYPSAQLAFHDLNAKCYKRYDAGKNEIRQSAAFNECNQQRKQFAERSKITDWVGTIDSISTNQGGSEVVVNITSDAGGFDIKYDTPGVGVQGLDMFTRDVIHANSPVYQKLANLKEGDRVRFDASFQFDSDRGINEESLTEAGSMESPAFTIRLDDVRQFSN